MGETQRAVPRAIFACDHSPGVTRVVGFWVCVYILIRYRYYRSMSLCTEYTSRDSCPTASL